MNVCHHSARRADAERGEDEAPILTPAVREYEHNRRREGKQLAAKDKPLRVNDLRESAGERYGKGENANGKHVDRRHACRQTIVVLPERSVDCEYAGPEEIWHQSGTKEGSEVGKEPCSRRTATKCQLQHV